MSDLETFLTEVSVMVDDALPPEARPRRPGPAPKLSPSEVITLALTSQSQRFRSGRDFYRFAEARLRPLFPTLPHRTQFLRQTHRLWAAIARFAVALGAELAAGAAFEILDATAMPTRNVARRGRGWLAGAMDKGWSSRLGWYIGGHVLTCISPTGAVTGFGLGPASVNDRALAETLLAQRAARAPTLPSAGRPLTGVYLADQGFGGQAVEARFRTAYRAELVCPPQPDRRTRVWAGPARRWLIRHRQIIETVHGHLLHAYRLDANRPHSVAGALVNLAAIAALHNVTIARNRVHGAPDLATTEVMGW
jgi:hypothetical protein